MKAKIFRRFCYNVHKYTKVHPTTLPLVLVVPRGNALKLQPVKKNKHSYYDCS